MWRSIRGERTDEHSELLNEGTECLLFSDEAELRDVLHWCARHPAQAAKIAEAGHARVTRDSHRYVDRARRSSMSFSDAKETSVTEDSTVAPSPEPTPRRRRVLLVCITVAVLLAGFITAGWRVYMNPQTDPLRPADAIVVLGGTRTSVSMSAWTWLNAGMHRTC